MLNPFKRTRGPVVTGLVVAEPGIASLQIRDLLEHPQLRAVMAVTSVAAMDTEQTVVRSGPARQRPRPYDREVDGLVGLDGAA